MSGLSLSSLSQRISRGQMRYFRDPFEANPQRARRIRLTDLEHFIHEGHRAQAGDQRDEVHAPHASRQTGSISVYSAG